MVMAMDRVRIVAAPALLLSGVLLLSGCSAAPGSGQPGSSAGPGTPAGTAPGSSPTLGASETPSAAPSSGPSAGIAATPGAAATPSPTPSRSIIRVSPPPASVNPSAIPATLMDAVLADAAGRTGADRGAMTLVRAQAATWPSSALGCAQPGHDYTDALVRGYWIVVDAAGRQLDYRATERGAFKLCENPPGPG
jgi:hypothetical protein